MEDCASKPYSAIVPQTREAEFDGESFDSPTEGKSTLETSGEDVKLHSKRVEKR